MGWGWCGWWTRPGTGFRGRAECQELEREGTPPGRGADSARYRDCTLDTFEIYHEADRSLAEALLTARRFVEEYPVGTAGKGLLFIG